MGKFETWCKSHDKFGEAITVKYQGEDSYKTVFGSILSVICLICVLLYGGVKGLEFKVGNEPETTFNPVVHNLT